MRNKHVNTLRKCDRQGNVRKGPQNKREKTRDNLPAPPPRNGHDARRGLRTFIPWFQHYEHCLSNPNEGTPSFGLNMGFWLAYHYLLRCVYIGLIFLYNFVNLFHMFKLIFICFNCFTLFQVCVKSFFGFF